MPDSLSQFYHTEIVHTGRLPMLVLLGGIIVTFLLIRLNTRLIRKGVRWWPGNFEKGDVHLHHVAIGLPVLFICGVLEFAFRPGWPWVEIIALCFGAAAALVFDEYALVLHVRDVYWKEEGRHSVVAVFLAAIFAAFLVAGVVPLAANNDVQTGEVVSRWSIAIVVAVNSGFVLVSFLKGKIWMGWIGFFLPMVAWVGAVRLARPRSPWARWFYRNSDRKIERARRRDVSFTHNVGRWRLKVSDLVSGAPDRPGRRKLHDSPAAPVVTPAAPSAVAPEARRFPMTPGGRAGT
jgi:hypothetical protein